MPDIPLPDLLTQEEARKQWCPMARTFADAQMNSSGGKCQAGQCIFWRFRHPGDARFQSAVAREEALLKEEMEKSGRKSGWHQEAVARVARNPWRYIIPSDEDRGYCGAAGRPEVAK